MKQLLWVTVGAGVAAVVLVKARDYLSTAGPDTIAGRVWAPVGRVEESARGFVARFRAAMVERETELRESLDLPQ